MVIIGRFSKTAEYYSCVSYLNQTQKLTLSLSCQRPRKTYLMLTPVHDLIVVGAAVVPRLALMPHSKKDLGLIHVCMLSLHEFSQGTPACSHSLKTHSTTLTAAITELKNLKQIPHLPLL